MDECFFCGAENVRLFDAVTDNGIVKVCKECSFNEHVPLIRRPTTFQLKEAEKRGMSFHERADRERKEIEKEKIKRASIEKQNITLKDIIDRNYKPSVRVDEKPKIKLIDNFHWIIMRARRKMHLTQAQLAQEIHEAEAAIKMIEQGVLPEDDYRLVNKLENFLGIRIREKGGDYEPVMESEPVRILDFKPDTIQNLTIADLQRLKKQKEMIEKQELMEEVKKKLESEEVL